MRRIENVLDRMPSSRRAVYVAVTLGLVALIGVIVWLIFAVQQNSDALARSAAINRSRGQALGTANAKLTQNGIPPVTPKPEKPTPGNTDLGPTTPSSPPAPERGAKGDRGDQGPGPSPAQVAQAVSAYCGQHECAPGPTQAQVAAAVATYCKGGTCDGPPGPTGRPGKAGQDATGKPGASGSPGASGPPGRAPTAEEISDAVAAYCAGGVCRGSAGPAGPVGPPGADGKSGKDGRDGATPPRFTKIECTPSNAWAFTLSDGSTITAAGPCRAETVTTTVTAPPSSPPAPTSTAP